MCLLENIDDLFIIIFLYTNYTYFFKVKLLPFNYSCPNFTFKCCFFIVIILSIF